MLFHFTQVFPRRRPWIKTSGIQMPIAYLLAPAAVAVLVRYAPATPEAITMAYVLTVIVFGFPLLILLGFVLPVAAIVSLVRSHREVRDQGLAHLRRPIEWILVSQIAGGTLTIVFAPGTDRAHAQRHGPVRADARDLGARPADAAGLCGRGLEIQGAGGQPRLRPRINTDRHGSTRINTNRRLQGAVSSPRPSINTLIRGIGVIRGYR